MWNEFKAFVMRGNVVEATINYADQPLERSASCCRDGASHEGLPILPLADSPEGGPLRAVHGDVHAMTHQTF